MKKQITKKTIIYTLFPEMTAFTLSFLTTCSEISKLFAPTCRLHNYSFIKYNMNYSFLRLFWRCRVYLLQESDAVEFCRYAPLLQGNLLSPSQRQAIISYLENVGSSFLLRIYFVIVQSTPYRIPEVTTHSSTARRSNLT